MAQNEKKSPELEATTASRTKRMTGRGGSNTQPQPDLVLDEKPMLQELRDHSEQGRAAHKMQLRRAIHSGKVPREALPIPAHLSLSAKIPQTPGKTDGLGFQALDAEVERPEDACLLEPAAEAVETCQTPRAWNLTEALGAIGLNTW